MTVTISHPFISAKSDGPDASKVQASNWNALHTITMAATSVLGNNTGGAAAATELSASQVFDLVSSTNGVLLTRTAGTWAPIANVTTDNGDLVLTVNASPVAPATGIKAFGASLAGRPWLSSVAPTNNPVAMQPFEAQRAVWFFQPRNDGVAPGTAYNTLFSFNLTFASRVVAATNQFTAASRVGCVSAATAGAVNYATGGAWALRGAVANVGGFFFLARFGVSDASLVGTANMFAGMGPTTVATAGDVAPSTLTNLIGVGCDSGDTNLQLYTAGSAAQARVSLGANFPVNTISTDIYELVLWCPPNAAFVNYQVTRLNTGNVASGQITAGASLPVATQLLTWCLKRSNGGTAAAVGVDIFSVYGEKEI